ncbi:MAG: peptidylprolyl isomerase [Bacteroidales bacterium]|nr:peptidylprolyl isomerase [Bacteroidales bacterium]
MLVLFILFLISSNIFAQEDVLLVVDNQKYTLDEFLSVYNKNSEEPLPDNINLLKKEVDKFVDLKLKIIEAENMGLDKTDDFIKEYKQYKRQLAEPFLIDKQKFKQLCTQAYQRRKNEIKVSHILVRVSPYAAPEDTLIAYQKAMNIRLRLEESERFENVAKETSDDPTAAYNGGDLWYVHAFELPYAFENLIYRTKPDKLLQIVRTNLGYEIFKVMGHRSNPGMIKVAHIMISVPANANKEQLAKAKRKVDDVYNKLLLGEKFDDLVKKYSDDVGMNNTGELPWFGTGEMEPAFEQACIDLHKSEFSKPVKTKYAWHIIKKIDQQAVPEYEFMVDQISKAIRESDRYEICKQNIVAKYKKQFNFRENKNISDFYDLVDSTLIFEGKWQAPSMFMLHEVLFKIGNKEYNKQQFVDFLVNKQRKMYPIPLKNYINMQYEQFKNQEILEFAYNQLAKTNNEYKRLISEFHDGILLFKFLEKQVWFKAQNDTLALINFYNKNIDKYNKYSADISVFKYSSEMNIKKMKKYFTKYKKQHIKDDLLAKVVSKSSKSNFEFIGNYQAEEGSDEVFDLVMNEFHLAKISSKQKIIILPDNKTLVYLNSAISRTQKPWTAFKSELIEDYQNKLEKALTVDLRKKHSVKINEEVLKSLLY